MTNNPKRFILHAILFTLFPLLSLGQSEYVIKQRIQESLEEFMNMLSYVNDEEEVITPSMMATRYSGGNYFRFNGKDMKLQNFIEDYCYSDLQRQIVNHSLSISPNNITKVSNNPSDQRWTANGILKREYAINKRDNISDESVKFTILWRGINEEIGLLELDFHSVLRMSVPNATSKFQASQKDDSLANAQSYPQVYLDKAINKLDAGDCDAAQRFYNVYKELSGNPIPSVEAMINDCKSTFHIGDIKEVNGEKYTIAYLTGNKKHGFAIRDIGVHDINNYDRFKLFDVEMMPTLVEMDTIYMNNDHIGLTGKYWTSTECGVGGSISSTKDGPWHTIYFFHVKNFLTGETSRSLQTDRNRVLIIHRF